METGHWLTEGAEIGQSLLHVGRQGRFETQSLAGTRMHESEHARVQRVAAQGFFDEAHVWVARGAPVDGIGKQRAPESLGQMHADLVRPPCFEPAFDERCTTARQHFDHRDVRDGLSPARCFRRELQPRTGMASVKRLDPSRRGDPLSQSTVDSLDRVFSELLFEPFAR